MTNLICVVHLKAKNELLGEFFTVIFKGFISLDTKYGKTCLHFLQMDFVHFCLQERKKNKLLQIDGKTHLETSIEEDILILYEKFILVLIIFSMRKVLLQFKLISF